MSTPLNLEEQMKLLVELQGLDTQIIKLTAEIDAIPEKIKASDDAFMATTANLKRLEDLSKGLQVKKKEREGALDAGEGTIKKYQGQLGQVKTNKEYTALLDEINRVKADDSLVEEAIINLMDEIDAASKKIIQEKEYLKTEEVKLAAEKKTLGEEATRLKAEAERYQKQRAELTAKIEKKILDKYTRILQNRDDGLAVVSIAHDTCQGCFRVMPPQVINEVRMRNAIIICENCARILYVED
jgi:uncharacterized protein